MRIIVLAAALAAIAGPAAAAIAPGRYCDREALEASPGQALGEFQADATIARAHGGLTLRFSDTMPDSGQTLDIGPAPLKLDGRGGYAFAFTDNWGAAGKGLLKPTRRGVSIDIDRTGDSGDGWGDNAGRNYGTFELSRTPCRRAR